MHSFFTIQITNILVAVINTPLGIALISIYNWIETFCDVSYALLSDNNKSIIYYVTKTKNVCYKNVENIQVFHFQFDEKFVIDNCECLVLSCVHGGNRMVVITTPKGDKIYNLETK